MTDSTDPDLSDVFRQLYQDDQDGSWAFSDDDEDVVSPVDGPVDDRDEVASSGGKYTRKRFLAAIDSLLDHRPNPKRQRIYTPPEQHTLSTSLIPSTIPIPSLPPLEPYKPFSPLALLARLQTYLPSTLSSLPILRPKFFAERGWISQSRDIVECVQCHAKVDLRSVTKIADENIKVEVAKRIGKGLDGQHDVTCPWKVRTSPGELIESLRNTLHPMMLSSLAPLATRLEDECMRGGEIAWSSPLSLSQLDTLQSHLDRHLDLISPQPAPSHLSTALAMFAWFPYHPNAASPGHYIDTSTPSTRSEIVSCRICQRRIGLWSFRKDTTPQRVFNLVDEHLEWCPIRSGVAWWENVEMLKTKDITGVEGLQGLKGWVKVSDKLEKKSWRRL